MSMVTGISKPLDLPGKFWFWTRRFWIWNPKFWFGVGRLKKGARQAILEDIWKRTVEKSQRNAFSVTLHPPRHASWRHIQQHSWEKSTRAISVIIHPPKQALWKDIYRTHSIWIATNVLLHAMTHTIWGDIWKHTVERNQTIMQSVWICILAGRPFEETFKTYNGKSQTNATNVICIILGKQFEDTFENTWWRKVWWFCILSGSQEFLEKFHFSISRHFHFTFHSRSRSWAIFISLFILDHKTFSFHFSFSKWVNQIFISLFTSRTSNIHSRRLNWNWVYCKSFFCSWLWRKFEQMQPV